MNTNLANSSIKLSSGTTISQYKELEKKKLQADISKFVRERLKERYVDSLKAKSKNGFLIMASMCLLIETLESFYRGLGDTRNKSELMFCSFFQRSGLSKDFSRYTNEFYYNVRCGILHQGESRGGWKIRRDGKLFDESKLTINATKFQKRIADEIDKYHDSLKNSPWDDHLWANFRKKMKVIIENCESH